MARAVREWIAAMLAAAFAELEVDRSAVEAGGVVHPRADREIADPIAVEISGGSEAEAGAGKAVRGCEAVANRFDPAVADDDGRSATRRLTWPIEQSTGVYENEGVGGCLREGGASCKRQQDG